MSATFLDVGADFIPDRRAASPYIVSLDIGKRNDFTALAITEKGKVKRPGLAPNLPERTLTAYAVRYLDRIRHTSYETIADNVAVLLARADLAGALFAIDVTGVGEVVADMFIKRKLKPKLIRIHGGSAVSREGDRYGVPKRDLVMAVAVTLESRRLQIAESLPLAETLTSELDNFKVKETETGHDTYGNSEDWRDDAHDDLTLAVAIGVWSGENLSNRSKFIRGFN